MNYELQTKVTNLHLFYFFVSIYVQHEVTSMNSKCVVT